MPMETPQHEIARLRRWIDELQSGMYINCVYCGHCYGPKDKVASTMADALKLHIAQCPQHPMHSVLKTLKAGRDLVSNGLSGADTIVVAVAQRWQEWLQLADAAIAAAEFVQPKKTARKK